MTDVNKIIELLHNPSKEDIVLITKAYTFAKKAHEGTKRFTGEPYFTHAFETAKNLALFGVDSCSVTAGFLHDVLEDGDVNEETLKKEFGEEILFLVDGVTKLGTLKYRGTKRHVESLRKLFIATSHDVRVLIIKLADRLHNIKTLGGHPEKEKRERIALETLEIFVPLADRLGMGRLKQEMEDYAFPYIYPQKYQTARKLFQQKNKGLSQHVQKFYLALQNKLTESDIKDIKTSYRIKGMYSLYNKLLRYEMDIDKIYDIVAFRVTVPTIEDCYQILGIVHSAWKPLPGRIKDYIAIPKPNGYQSIHSTVFTGDGEIVEIQIRTRQMHREAEYGIASHLAYKEKYLKHSIKQPMTVKKQLGWIQELLQWQKEVSESGIFLKDLKMDFFKFRVFVFTPKGDVIDLPIGATPIDFAYAIHSDIGNHTAEAKINRKMASLKTKLKSGDLVEIITKKKACPTRKWLDYTETNLAYRQIHLYLQKNQGR